MIRLSLRSSQSCHSWSSFIFTKSNENNPVILWSGRVFQQLMNLVTFAPCLEARLDPTLRKKSHGENASVSDCLTRNSPKKKLLTCCSFCTYLEKTPCAIFFVKCPLNLPIPKTCQRGFKSYTPHSYDSWDWPTNWNKTLQMMNPMAECTKIIKTRKRTGSKTNCCFPTYILVLPCEGFPNFPDALTFDVSTLVCPPSFFVLRFCWWNPPMNGLITTTLNL